MRHRCLTFDEDDDHFGFDTFTAMAMVMLLRYYICGKVLVATYIISKTCAQITKNQLSEALVVLSFSMPSELIICLKCSNDD